MRIIKLVAVIGVAITLMAVVAALWPASPATAEGGIIKPVKVARLISETTYMATDPLSTFVTSAAYVGDFGAVQYQIKVDVPDDEILGPRVITWTPQFSIQPLASGANCDSVTEWFDGTDYQSVYVNGIPVILDPLPVSARTLGTEIIGFEAQAAGACTRVKAVVEQNVLMTTTIDLRAINRQ